MNELIRRYRKPDEIHVELARDLKRNRKEHWRRKKNHEQEALRKEAREALQKYANLNWKRADEIKYLLWKECGHTCPYSGKTISLKSLFDEPLFDVEHIIPYPRSLDH